MSAAIFHNHIMKRRNWLAAGMVLLTFLELGAAAKVDDVNAKHLESYKQNLRNGAVNRAKFAESQNRMSEPDTRAELRAALAEARKQMGNPRRIRTDRRYLAGHDGAERYVPAQGTSHSRRAGEDDEPGAPSNLETLTFDPRVGQLGFGHTAGTITDVDWDSQAALEPGWKIVSVNGVAIPDYIGLHFLEKRHDKVQELVGEVISGGVPFTITFDTTAPAPPALSSTANQSDPDPDVEPTNGVEGDLMAPMCL